MIIAGIVALAAAIALPLAWLKARSVKRKRAASRAVLNSSTVVWTALFCGDPKRLGREVGKRHPYDSRAWVVLDMFAIVNNQRMQTGLVSERCHVTHCAWFDREQGGVMLNTMEIAPRDLDPGCGIFFDPGDITANIHGDV